MPLPNTIGVKMSGEGDWSGRPEGEPRNSHVLRQVGGEPKEGVGEQAGELSPGVRNSHLEGLLEAAGCSLQEQLNGLLGLGELMAFGDPIGHGVGLDVGAWWVCVREDGVVGMKSVEEGEVGVRRGGGQATYDGEQRSCVGAKGEG